MRIIGVIPARYASTRLQGKPLKEICGKPMIWWVYMNAKRVKEFSEVIVATDDKRIEKYCNENGMNVIVTKNTHLTAANRLYEVSTHKEADFYVQINGDEPLITAKVIEKIIPETVVQEYEYGINLISKIEYPDEIKDVSNIKVVFDSEMNAIYMSRVPVPYFKELKNVCYFKHLGIIGYNKKMLDFYEDSVPGYLERMESIDTLRFIDYGKMLKCQMVDVGETLSVDTYEDLIEVDKRMRELCKQG